MSMAFWITSACLAAVTAGIFHTAHSRDACKKARGYDIDDQVTIVLLQVVWLILAVSAALLAWFN